MTVFTDRDIGVLESTALSMSRALHPSHPAVLDTYRKLADAHVDRQDHSSALSVYSRILFLISSGGNGRVDAAAASPAVPCALPPLPECAAPDEVRRYADTLGKIGDVHSSRGDYGDAIAVYRHTLFLYVGNLGDGHPFVGRIRRNLGILLHQTRRDGEADDMFERALRAFLSARRRASPTPGEPWDADVLDRDVALTHRTMGGVAEERADYTGAILSYAACAEVYVDAQRRRRSAGMLPAVSGGSPGAPAELAEVYRAMALCHSALGHDDETVRCLEAAVGAYQAALDAAGGGPPAAFAAAVVNGGTQGSNARAAAADMARGPAQGHPRYAADRGSSARAPPALRPDQAGLYRRMAELYRMLSSVQCSKLYEAQDYNTKALKLYRAVDGELSAETAGAHLAIAELYDKMDKHELAMGYYRASLKSRGWYRDDGGGRWRPFVRPHPARDDVALHPSPDEVGGDDETADASDDSDLPEIATTLIKIAALHSLDGRSEQALQSTEEALAARRNCFSDHHPMVAGALNSTGILRCRTGDLDGALVAYWELLGIRRVVYGCGHTKVTETLKTIGKVLEMKGDYAEAADVFTEALTIYENNQKNGAGTGRKGRSPANSESPRDSFSFPFDDTADAPAAVCPIHPDPHDDRCPSSLERRGGLRPAPGPPGVRTLLGGRPKPTFAAARLPAPPLWDGSSSCFTCVLDDGNAMTLMRLVVNLKRSVKDCANGSYQCVFDTWLDVCRRANHVMFSNLDGTLNSHIHRSEDKGFKALDVSISEEGKQFELQRKKDFDQG